MALLKISDDLIFGVARSTLFHTWMVSGACIKAYQKQLYYFYLKYNHLVKQNEMLVHVCGS